jgi:hypothetical protein
MRRVIWIGLLQELADDGAFEQRLVVVLQSRDQSSGIEREERVRFVVWVHFNVLVWYLLFLQDCPGTLYERAAGMLLVTAGNGWKSNCCLQPARVELQWLFFLVSIDNCFGWSSGDWVEVRIWMGAHCG